MLVLSRKVGEDIVIGSDIRITVVAITGGKVRIGITAPKEVVVDRQEVHENRQSFICDEPTLIPAPNRLPDALPFHATRTGPRTFPT